MNIKIFILLSLVSLAHLHNLEDTWALRTSEIPTLQSLKAPIYFQFARSLSGDGKNIVGYLTITACNILSYNYNVTDSQIFLYFVSKGRTTRTCLKGEITYLRSKLDQIFYFYIMYNSLLLMPANNNSPIKLDIVDSTSMPSLNGIWTISDPNSGNKVVNGSVVINGTQMSFCQGSQLINYNLTSNVKINLTNVKNTSGCNDNFINVFASSSRFVKVNRVDNPQTVTFFNDKVKPVLKLAFQGTFQFNKFVTVNQSSSKLSPTKTNVTSSGKNATVSNPSLPKNSSNATTTNNQQNSNKTITNSTTQSNASLNNNITKSNISSTKTTNQTSNSNTTASTNTAAKDSNTSAPANKTSTSKNISTATTTTTSSLPVLVSQANQVFGIWYPSSSLIHSSLTAASLLKYQLIINTARLMLSGGCNAIFSTYTFSSGSFKPNNIISTSNSCPNNQDNIIKEIIFNPSNQYYISGSGNSAKLTINSPQNATLLLFTQTAPS